jgi:hypothetical protein
MPTYTGPKLVKGAILTFGSDTSVGNVIIFQYNPSALSRTLTPAYIGGAEGDRAEGVRFQGAPVETIGLTMQIDAVDQLEAGQPDAVLNGIHPQLAALELLTAPSLQQAAAAIAKLDAGVLEVMPEIAPLTMFVFGINRMVPVRIKDVSVTEEAHDAILNPIRAQVTLNMQVLTYSNQDPASQGAYQYFRYQSHKAALAQTAIASIITASSLLGTGDPIDASESL